MKYLFPIFLTVMIWCLCWPGLTNTSTDSTENVATSNEKEPSLIDALTLEQEFDLPPLVTEPKYDNTPHYAVIAIGENRDNQIWVVVDGEKLFVDFNEDGNLDDPAEVFEADEAFTFDGATFSTYHLGEIYTADSIHTELTVVAGVGANSVSAKISMRIDGERQSRNSHMSARDMVPESQRAPVFHFGGPVSMGLYEVPQQLTPGKETDFYALVGTPGTGRKTLTALEHRDANSEVHPKAKFVFQNRTDGEPPLTVVCHLTERC